MKVSDQLAKNRTSGPVIKFILTWSTAFRKSFAPTCLRVAHFKYINGFPVWAASLFHTINKEQYLDFKVGKTVSRYSNFFRKFCLTTLSF